DPRPAASSRVARPTHRAQLHSRRRSAARQEPRGTMHLIDDVNDRRQRCHAASILDNGSVKQNTAPPPGRFSAHILPPWVSTIARAIDRPSPVPSRLVV